MQGDRLLAWSYDLKQKIQAAELGGGKSEPGSAEEEESADEARQMVQYSGDSSVERNKR
jgi:hypothetical protein